MGFPVPVGDVVDEVLLEHEAPAFDDVEKRLFEWSGVHTEPELKDHGALESFNLFVDLLICINLREKRYIRVMKIKT